MLVCPDCQFENPNTNKFCQNCGTSLTHKTCQNCGTQVPINAETCHNCNAFTGTVWMAIISRDSDSLIFRNDEQLTSAEASNRVVSDTDQAEVPPLEVFPEFEGKSSQAKTSPITTPLASSESVPLLPKDVPAVDNRPASAEPEEIEDEDVTQPLLTSRQSNHTLNSDSKTSNKNKVTSSTSTVVYLDNQQRYRLLDSPNLDSTGSKAETHYGESVRVLDCQPFQKSLLEALIEQQQTGAEIFEPLGKTPSAATVDAWNVLGIPAIAQPYLALKKFYYQTLPAVHDAWAQDGEAVVLLEDRSEWQLLSELWDSEQLSTLQILYWLDEMAKLWEALEPWHCRQSLLETTNLRVDEDQTLGLVRLYLDLPGKHLTLQDLGKLWQRLFDQSQRTQFTTLAALFRQMCTREISTIPELRSRLEAIARQHQALMPPASQNEDVNPVDLAESSSDEDEEGGGSTQLLRESSESGGNNDDIEPTVILPMQLMSLDDAGCTDIGQQRPHNEDAFGIQTLVRKLENPMGRSVQARGLYIVCDGMGGHSAGEVASGMAVETIKRFFQEHWSEDDQLPGEETVREAIRAANQAIFDVNQKNARSGSGRMGTTLAMMLIQNTNAVIAHVGDTRIYRLTRKRGLEQLTVDHEVGKREEERGVAKEIAYARPDAYQLTQAVGPRSDQSVNPDVQFLELNEDTLFVICSDGLSDYELIETHWQTHLAPLLSSRANLDQGILQLIELANQHTGHDNITAILIRVKVRPNFEQQQLLYR